jgi:predicted RNA-binding protein with PUA-like domain
MLARSAAASVPLLSRGRRALSLGARALADGAMPPARRPRAPKPAVEEAAAATKRQKRSSGGSDAAPAGGAAAADAAAKRGIQAFWLVKSEPHEYSVDDLAADKGGGRWDGVRNYVARNNMRAMRRGDLCLFYHSSCAAPAAVAVARVTSKEAYPDPTALEKGGRYYDEKHTTEAPRWFCVDLALERRLRRAVTLRAIKRRAAAGGGGGGAVLAGMQLLTRPRLSVQPVTAAEWAVVMAMEQEEEEAEEEEEEVKKEGKGKGKGKEGR